MNYEKDGFVSIWMGKVKSVALLEALMEEKYPEEGESFSFSEVFIR